MYIHTNRRYTLTVNKLNPDSPYHRESKSILERAHYPNDEPPFNPSETFHFVLILGGTKQQPTHADNKANARKKWQTIPFTEAELKTEMMSGLVSLSKLWNVNLAVYDKWAEDGKKGMDVKKEDVWMQVKREFRLSDRASVKDYMKGDFHYGRFSAPIIVFDATVYHAGLPANRAENPKEGSAMDLIIKRVKTKAPITIDFLKSLSDLQDISRLFFDTWPSKVKAKKTDLFLSDNVEYPRRENGKSGSYVCVEE